MWKRCQAVIDAEGWLNIRVKAASKNGVYFSFLPTRTLNTADTFVLPIPGQNRGSEGIGTYEFRAKTFRLGATRWRLLTPISLFTTIPSYISRPNTTSTPIHPNRVWLMSEVRRGYLASQSCWLPKRCETLCTSTRSASHVVSGWLPLNLVITIRCSLYSWLATIEVNMLTIRHPADDSGN